MVQTSEGIKGNVCKFSLVFMKDFKPRVHLHVISSYCSATITYHFTKTILK